MFTGFVAVLAMVLHGGHLVVAFGVIFAFITAYFAVPWMFPGAGRKEGAELGRVQRVGIMTATGHSTCA